MLARVAAAVGHLSGGRCQQRPGDQGELEDRRQALGQELDRVRRPRTDGEEADEGRPGSDRRVGLAVDADRQVLGEVRVAGARLPGLHPRSQPGTRPELGAPLGAKALAIEHSPVVDDQRQGHRVAAGLQEQEGRHRDFRQLDDAAADRLRRLLRGVERLQRLERIRDEGPLTGSANLVRLEGTFVRDIARSGHVAADLARIVTDG